MGDRPTDTAVLAAYFRLAKEKPRWFSNPDSKGYQILLSRAEIDASQSARAAEMARQGYPAEWAQVGVLFEDQYLRVLRDAVRRPDGTLGTYIRIVGPCHGADGVAIFPVLSGKVVLVDHFRHATRARHLELPRGFGEAGLTWEESARRELQEEIGAIPARVEDLGYLHPDTGISSERVQLIFASLQSIGEPEAGEAIAAVVTLTIAELEDKIASGELTDSFTIAAYTRARLRGLVP